MYKLTKNGQKLITPVEIKKPFMLGTPLANIKLYQISLLQNIGSRF